MTIPLLQDEDIVTVEPPFWVLLTAFDGVQYYAWTEQIDTQDGFVEMPGGREGQVTFSPTFEPNGVLLQVGDYVRIKKSYYSPTMDWVYVIVYCPAQPVNLNGGQTHFMAWQDSTVTGGVNSVKDWENIISVVRNSAGNFTVTFSVAFATSGSFTWSGSAVGEVLQEISRTTTSVTVETVSGNDPTEWGIMVIGHVAEEYQWGTNTDGPTVTPSVAELASTATSMYIYGTGFDTTPGNNLVYFSNGAVGTVTAATATRLTVSISTAPASMGLLQAVVVTNGDSSGIAVPVANIVAGPTVTLTTTSQDMSIPIVTVTGTGFDYVPGNNTVTFNLGAIGTVIAATPTSLTVQLSTLPTNIGDLTAVVTTHGVTSGAAVKVAEITGSVTFTSSGTWTATFTGNLRVDCIGGSGRATSGVTGDVSGGGGGAGGDFARYNAYAVTLSTVYTYKIGEAGVEPATYFDNILTIAAYNGADSTGASTGGVAGPSGSSVGNTVRGGGAGGNGGAGASGGGGGGEAASFVAAGNNGSNASGGTGGAGGTGADGANGGAGGSYDAGNGTAGTNYGGGPGGGAAGSASFGDKGAATKGLLTITRT